MESSIFKNFLAEVHRNSPLTLCLTNTVTINDCANALLSIGASPVMSDDLVDARELAALASATVLNIGMINSRTLEMMIGAGQVARDAKRPVILDPVGAGATSVRLRASQEILEKVAPTIIRGNVSEIMALAGLTGSQKGVDSSAKLDRDRLTETARELSTRFKAVVAVTGAEDIITDGQEVIYLEGGTPLLTKLTGTGCLLSAIVGGYAGASPASLFLSTAAALRHLSLAGERAEAALRVPGTLGSFKVALFNHLSLMQAHDL